MSIRAEISNVRGADETLYLSSKREPGVVQALEGSWGRDVIRIESFVTVDDKGGRKLEISFSGKTISALFEEIALLPEFSKLIDKEYLQGIRRVRNARLGIED